MDEIQSNEDNTIIMQSETVSGTITQEYYEENIEPLLSGGVIMLAVLLGAICIRYIIR